MKNKHLLSTLIQRNPSELTPWQSEVISTPINPETQTIQSFPQSQTITKKFLPKLIINQPKSSQRLTKIQYQLAKNQIIPNHKTFEIIKTAKQTAFNGFITKYKIEPKTKNRRYLMVSKDQILNSSLQLPQKVKFINFSTHQTQDESQTYDQLNHYQSKQIQFSRKRSLSNIIKSIGKDKFIKLKQTCLHSPWMLTNCLSPHKYRKTDDKDVEKTQKNIKLLELNLGIRQRNISNYRTIKN